eukprot:TRINITY_DN7301_c0_g1_i1.p1 TRINITY_DN7301_c0_g1~~TRINITY_DN7301_c0_g1_i1.p1  ORF type:complete len:118 (-),score=22.05 TRINITY_DN7301_c0_g1_i1:52-405(-)
MPKQQDRKKNDRTGPVTVVTTFNLHKTLHGKQFRKRAPRAIREIKKYVSATMGTSDVRVTPLLNQQIWSRGVKVPIRRVRISMERKRSDEDDEATYTLVDYVQVSSFKGLTTKKVEA